MTMEKRKKTALTSEKGQDFKQGKKEDSRGGL